MTFWGGSRLAVEGKTKKIVDPFDSKRIDCSAYELTLGAEAYVTPKHGDNPRDNVKDRLAPPQPESSDGKTSAVSGGTVVIPPGQFALLLTEEKVALPASVMGFISLRSDPKFRGLINVSGFHVDPGFRGRLIFSVYNAGPAPIHLDRGDRLFQLWIADLSGDRLDEYTRKKEGYSNIPSELISKVSRERHSLQALSDRVDALGFQVRLFTSLAAGVVTAGSLLLAITKLGLFEPPASTPVAIEAPKSPEKVLPPKSLTPPESKARATLPAPKNN